VGAEQMIHHPTQLQTFQQCPMRYKLRVLDAIAPSWGNFFAVRGTIIHRVFNEGFDKLTRIFWEEMKKNDPVRMYPSSDLSMEKKQALHDDLVTLLPGYWDYLNFWDIEIRERERTFQFDFANAHFQGTVDAIAVHPDTPEGMVEIHDYKSGRKFGREALSRNLQFGLYYVAATLNGYTVNRVFWCHVKDLEKYKADSKKTAARKGDRKGQFLYSVRILPEDLPLLETQVKTILTCIDRGLFFWNSYGSDAPCEPFCEFAHTGDCPAYKTDNQHEDIILLMQQAKAMKELEL
jgi:RecB family exonuclease